MKNFMQKATQKIMLVMACLIVFNFVAPYSRSYAVDADGIGGILTSALVGLFGMVGDALLGIIQYAMIGPTPNPDSGGEKDFTIAVYPSKKTIVDEKGVFNKDTGEIIKEGYDFMKQDEGVTPKKIYAKSFFYKAEKETYGIPIIRYDPQAIFSGKIPALDVNFIQGTNNDADMVGQQSRSSVKALRDVIAKWYVAIRNLALVGLLSVLVYIGIRMIMGSASSEKAKYKQMLMDWLVAMCLLFTLHFIMSFIMVIIDNVTKMVASSSPGINITILEGATEENAGKTVAKFKTNLIGWIRLNTQSQDELEKIGYLVIYIILVGFTAMFTWTYLKRLLYMAFLTLMAPLVSLTYPIDKISDGKAQAFDMWLKEYIFNALLQPFHLLLYTILVTSAIDLVAENAIYAIAAIFFLIPAEQLLRKMFGFEKAGTASGLAGFAGGALASQLINKLGSKGSGKSTKSSSSSESSSKNDGVTQKKTADYGGFDTSESTGTGELNDDKNRQPELEEGAQPEGQQEPKPTQIPQDNDSEFQRRLGQQNETEGLPEQEEGQPSDLHKGQHNPQAASSSTPKELTPEQKEKAENKQRRALRNQKAKRKIQGVWKGSTKVAKKSIKSGGKKVGKFLGKSALRAAGAVALGGTGFMLGAMTGDFKNAMQMAGGAAASGALLGGKAASAVGTGYDKLKNIKSSDMVKTYREAAYGKKEAALMASNEAFKKDKANREYFASEFEKPDGTEYKKSELDELMEQAASYREYGITDLGDIKKAMKLEKTIQEEGASKEVAFKQASLAMQNAGDHKTKDLYDPAYRQNIKNDFKQDILSGAKKEGRKLTPAQAEEQSQMVVRRIMQAKGMDTSVLDAPRPQQKPSQQKPSQQKPSQQKPSQQKPEIILPRNAPFSIDDARGNKKDR